MAEVRISALVVTSLLVSTVVLSGCLLFGDADSATISNENATERALSAEADYIFSQLANASCVDRGAPSGHGNEHAEVIKRTNQGVHVRVDHPYHYSSGELEADAETTARYRVNQTSAIRLRGSSISPC